MRLLVTGGSGFLGRRVLPAAIGRGHQVTALARSADAARTVESLGARPITGDLDDPASLDEAFGSARSPSTVDALVNLASLGFGHAPDIIAATELAGIRRAVFVSTTAVSTTLPAPSKRVRLSAEAAVRASRTEWTIIRPTMIYGARGDRNISRLLTALRRTPLLPVPGGGHKLVQPVHVDDLAGVVLDAVESTVAIGRTYEVAGPLPLTLAELLRECAWAVGSGTRFVPVPLRPTIALARGYERLARLLARQPRLRAEQIQRLAEDKAFDIGAAARDLGFAPRGFRAGITEQARAR